MDTSAFIQQQKKERGENFSPSEVKLVDLLLSYCFLAVSHAFLVEGVASIVWSH
jgi:hypothetical protein